MPDNIDIVNAITERFNNVEVPFVLNASEAEQYFRAFKCVAGDEMEPDRYGAFLAISIKNPTYVYARGGIMSASEVIDVYDRYMRAWETIGHKDDARMQAERLARTHLYEMAMKECLADIVETPHLSQTNWKAIADHINADARHRGWDGRYDDDEEMRQKKGASLLWKCLRTVNSEGVTKETCSDALMKNVSELYEALAQENEGHPSHDALLALSGWFDFTCEQARKNKYALQVQALDIDNNRNSVFLSVINGLTGPHSVNNPPRDPVLASVLSAWTAFCLSGMDTEDAFTISGLELALASNFDHPLNETLDGKLNELSAKTAYVFAFLACLFDFEQWHNLAWGGGEVGSAASSVQKSTPVSLNHSGQAPEGRCEITSTTSKASVAPICATVVAAIAIIILLVLLVRPTMVMFDNSEFDSLAASSSTDAKQSGKGWSKGGSSVKLTVLDGDNVTKLHGKVTRDADEYVIADSSTKKYSKKAIRKMGLSNAALCVAWNEPFARKGYHFNNDGLRKYFKNCSWYTDKGLGQDDISLSAEAKANIRTLKAVAEEQGGATWETLQH